MKFVDLPVHTRFIFKAKQPLLYTKGSLVVNDKEIYVAVREDDNYVISDGSRDDWEVKIVEKEPEKVYRQLRDCNWGDIVKVKSLEDGVNYRFVGVSGKGGPVNMLLDETQMKLIACDLNWLVE